MTEHTNQYCNCHDCTQVRYKSSLAGQVDAAMNNAQPAAPPAEAQSPNRFIPDMAHCARCKKADNLHSPDGICPPQEPKAQEAWMTVTNIHIRKSEDGTWICFKSKDGQAAFSIGNMFPDGAVRRHVIAQWAEEQMERAAIAPDVTALVEATEHLRSVIDAAGVENLSRGVELGPTVWYVKMQAALDWIDYAIAAVKEKANGR